MKGGAAPTMFTSKVVARQFVAGTFFAYLFGGGLMFTRTIDFSHEHEWFLGVLFFASAALLLLPRLLHQMVHAFQTQISEVSLARFEVLLTSAMFLSWMGSMGLYRAGIGYDSFVHFSTSVMAAFALSIPLATLMHTKRLQVFVTLVGMVILLGLFVEFGEWLGDVVVGTTMFGELGQPGDTYRDLVYDALGAVVGSALVVSRWDQS